MRVWIQRGHCFRRSGSTGTTGEQDYVNDIAHRAARLMTGHTVKVALADEGITGRWDLFVALHCDGSVSGSASGASIGYRDADGRRAGTVWKDRFRALGWPYGFRGDNYTAALSGYYGTGWAARAGIPAAFILEHGFLTNPTKDRPWLRSETGRRAAAQALADTVTILAGGQPDDPTTEDGETMQRSNRARGDGAAAAVQEICEDWRRALNSFRKAAGMPASTLTPLVIDDAPGTKTINRVQYVCRRARPETIPDPSDNSMIHMAHVDVVVFEAARLRQAANSLKDEASDEAARELVAEVRALVDRLED